MYGTKTIPNIHTTKQEPIELPASNLPRQQNDTDTSSDDGEKNENAVSMGPDPEGSGSKDDDSPTQ